MFSSLAIVLINFAKELVMLKNDIPITTKTLLIVLVSLTVFLLTQAGCSPFTFQSEKVAVTADETHICAELVDNATGTQPATQNTEEKE